MGLPASCANGKYIVFTWAGYHGSPSANIWRVDSDGTNPKQITDEHDLRAPVCSPDGQWVYFRDWFSQEIKRAPIDGGKAEVVPGTKIPDAELDDTPVAISPDGQWLAFSIHVEPEGNETAHQTKIVLLRLSDDQPDQRGKLSANAIKVIVSLDQRISGPASFTPDGRAVVYPIRAAGVDNLWLQPLETSADHMDPSGIIPSKTIVRGPVPGRQITNFTTDLIDAYHFSLDGKQLGVLQRHAVSDVVLLRDTSK